MSDPNNHTVIVGAGVAGLTLAERLLTGGYRGSVTVLERENAPGGLARTFTREGFNFDIGPHRFHTSDPDVERYLLEILGDDHITIARVSSVYMEKRSRNWPLTLGAVLGLPAPVLLRSLADMLRPKPKTEPRTFADHIVARYGRNLYEYFFRGYTRKFAGMEAENLHLDWAAAGVNRAIIDKKVKADSLLSLVKGVLLPKPVATKFYYTASGGIQTFCEMQSQRIESLGGEVRLLAPASGIATADGRVTGVELTDGTMVPADTVHWSAPISILFPDAGFRFINTLLCNIGLARPAGNDYQWCYFGQEDILFSRLTVPRCFRSDTVPEGRDSLVVEITTGDGSPEWKDPDLITDRVVEDLEKVGALRREDILFMDWKRVPETYPLYDLEYRDRLAGISLPAGLHLLGRCGSFWYNNMDHSIGQALATASGGTYHREFWES